LYEAQRLRIYLPSSGRMDIREILTKYWGHSSFRSSQEEIIQAVLQGKDTLALLPTGGGKSICFQVPAMAMDGICIVVSPLIALMRDQVQNLNSRGIKAMAVNSAMTKREIDIAIDNCVYGNYKFLYVSPERLTTEIFKARAPKMKVNLIAVDEAHCVSQWGYDFRPAYLQIAALRELLPGIPVLALTATATPDVITDIQEKLMFRKTHVIRKSFERKNLAFVVQKQEDKFARLLKICTKIKGSGIVYVRNRRKTQETADYLRSHGITADYYHAGMPAPLRDKKQEAWMTNQIRVIASTNAFGMGIDKSDVRFVVHMDLPDCIESYFQEAGRAGRDERKAFAVLLWNEQDKQDLEENIISAFPPIADIRQTYQALANFYQIGIGSGVWQNFDFDISRFCDTYNLKQLTVFHSLKLLEREGYLSLSEAFFNPSRIYFGHGREALYKFQVANKKYDEFIKLILRSYTGTFEQYVKINESDIAGRAGMTRAEVVNLLEYLNKMEVISWIPQTELPQLLYTRERCDAKDVYISPANYAERKQKVIGRMESMFSYCATDHRCRSRQLLAYFGETNTDDCGHCDVCLEAKQKQFNHAEFDEIMTEIVSLISIKPHSLRELVDHVSDHREEKVLKVVRWLIEHEEISYDTDNKLTFRIK
jgi:ATP-dependent DNA helicase RecQ